MKTSRGALLAGLGLVALPLIQTCTTRQVVGVEIGTVTTHPSSASLVDGQGLQFSAIVTDQRGQPLLGASVSWTTDDPAVVSIDPSGFVEALEAGTATIRASLQGVEGTATVEVLPSGAIVLSADSAAFQGSEGGAPPAPVVIQVLSTGAGTIGSLQASVDYAPAQPEGWLSAHLAGSEPPTSLTLTPETSALSGGSYQATVVVDSDAEHGPVQVRVSLFLLSTRVLVIESDGSTVVSESGERDDFAVVLEAAPSSDIVIELASTDPTEVTLGTTRLTFTPSSWNVAQTVTVAAPDDPTLDGDVVTPVTLRIVHTESPGQTEEPEEVVIVTTIDDDEAGFTVRESGDRTTVSSEEDDDFTVVLDAQPMSDVVIDLESEDPSRVAVSPSRLTFTPETWDTPRVVVVTGPADGSFSFRRIDVTLSVNDALSDDGFDPVPDQVVRVRRLR